MNRLPKIKPNSAKEVRNRSRSRIQIINFTVQHRIIPYHSIVVVRNHNIDHNTVLFLFTPKKETANGLGVFPTSPHIFGGGNTCTKSAQASDGSTRASECPGGRRVDRLMDVLVRGRYGGVLKWGSTPRRSIMDGLGRENAMKISHSNGWFGVPLFWETSICVNTFWIVWMTILILSTFDMRYMQIDVLFCRCTWCSQTSREIRFFSGTFISRILRCFYDAGEPTHGRVMQGLCWDSFPDSPRWLQLSISRLVISAKTHLFGSSWLIGFSQLRCVKLQVRT